jgi:hypothetical protein
MAVHLNCLKYSVAGVIMHSYACLMFHCQGYVNLNNSHLLGCLLINLKSIVETAMSLLFTRHSLKIICNIFELKLLNK